MASLKDLVKGNIFDNSPSVEEEKWSEDKTAKHRHDDVKRPEEEVELLSISREEETPRRSSKDPVDLLELDLYMSDPALVVPSEIGNQSFLVYCKWSDQLWYSKDRTNLNMNFIYRDDLDIIEIHNFTEFLEVYGQHNHPVVDKDNPLQRPSTACWILDNPANESYEVYNVSAYPSLKYGKATPTGMFVHRYQNRFYRDMAILELDDLYSNQSSKQAGKLVSEPMKGSEAIIISDGAWMKNSCSSAFIYIDNTTVVRQTVGHLPSEVDQGVLISEIVGATEALRYCMAKNKKRIKYYYDNTSILNVFKNRKTEYISEIKEYKDLLQKMDEDAYQVEFIELHPKTDENRDKENKALMFFHNMCDRDCREMTDIYTKDYKTFANDPSVHGQSFKKVKETLNKQNNNKKNGNNKYGRRF